MSGQDLSGSNRNLTWYGVKKLGENTKTRDLSFCSKLSFGASNKLRRRLSLTYAASSSSSEPPELLMLRLTSVRPKYLHSCRRLPRSLIPHHAAQHTCPPPASPALLP